MQETLRLHPPVPNDPKVCVSDDKLPSGYEIKKGSIVAWSGWCMVIYQLKNEIKNKTKNREDSQNIGTNQNNSFLKDGLTNHSMEE